MFHNSKAVLLLQWDRLCFHVAYSAHCSGSCDLRVYTECTRKSNCFWNEITF